MRVKVCDCVPGAGKTEAAIRKMNASPLERYLFVTPFLDEIQRIKRSCPDLDFAEPEDGGMFHTKIDSLHDLLSAGRNVACTHALFAFYTEYTRSIIREMGYILILDEVMNVIEAEKISKNDVKLIFSSGLARVSEDGHVIWLDNDYNGTKFASIMKKAQLDNLLFYRNTLMFWSLPVSSFGAFKDIYILTYLFSAQMQRYYYQINGVEFDYIGVRETEDGYEFTDRPEVPEYARRLIDKVHILDDEKLHRMGSIQTALSSSWYKKAHAQPGHPMITRLANHVYNAFRNKFNCSKTDAMWTTFKIYEEFFGSNGFSTGYVPCNARATNKYRDRHYLAYCVNIYFSPLLKRYFFENGARIDEDTYALSEMIQWIWRSAIRCGEDIWIYIPSKRMKDLLVNWLQSLADAPRETPVN